MKTFIYTAILIIILGFPRVYGTEIPMAVLLAPFFMIGFVNVFVSRGWFSFLFMALYTLWFFCGILAFFNGGGASANLFFHVVISVKMIMNMFFGYVVFLVIIRSPNSLLLWIVFQIFCIVFSVLSHDIYSFLLGFISPRSADAFQHIFGLRAIGFGLYHLDGVVVLASAVFFLIFTPKSVLIKNIVIFIVFPFAMLVARSSIVVYSVFGSLQRGLGIKSVFFLSLLLMALLSFFTVDGPLFEAVELFRNLIESGEIRSSSVSSLSNMYVFPSALNVYTFGDGLYFSKDTHSLEFYKGTDVGYLRILYYSGLGSVFLFIALNVSSVFYLSIINKSIYFQYKRYALSLIFVFIIINFKGIQVMPIFAYVLYFYFYSEKLSKNV